MDNKNMPIGSDFSLISNNKISKILYEIFGTLDLHSHIRLKPVHKYFKNYIIPAYSSGNKLKILEIGCGDGMNVFEINRILQKKNIDYDYVAIDLSATSISNAKKILIKKDNISNINFFQDNAINFLKNYKGSSFDIILMTDVIEHIENRELLLKLACNILKTGGLFVISVPTPLYPKIFGRKFSTKIGHLIDGFYLPQLDDLFIPVNCSRILYKYNTGVFSNIGCWLFYNKLNFNNKYLNILKCLLLYPFRFFDFWNNSKISCSLFAVYKNEK